jgi:hypothetical protein
MRTRTIHGQTLGGGGVVKGLVNRYESHRGETVCLVAAVDLKCDGELYGVVRS